MTCKPRLVVCYIFISNRALARCHFLDTVDQKKRMTVRDDLLDLFNSCLLYTSDAADDLFNSHHNFSYLFRFPNLVLKFLDYQAGIDTTKSQGVGQGIVDIHRNTLAHRVIQIAALACLF